jgi:N-carbamoyl-L-amino-acid hydrolase
MKADTTALRVDGTRLWDSLMQMAEHGRTDRGGCDRQALTDADRAGRDLFVHWCRAAGCDARVDRMGNIFARRPGLDPAAPPVLAGSHLDTQPAGGRFDGVYGVLAGLEVIRSLDDAGVRTRHAVEVVCWTNEEGARFSPAMIGSGVWAGAFELAYAYAREDHSGATLEAELRRIGYLGDAPCRAGAVKAAFEAHIEQGPVLEQAGAQIGVVTGVQGMRWYEIVLEGQACHAGTTPMETRRDPVRALGGMLQRLWALADAHAPAVRMTFGQWASRPGSRNTVPGSVTLSVDLRHPESALLDRIEADMERIVLDAGTAAGVQAALRPEWRSAPVEFDPACVDSVQRAAQALGYRSLRMVSGAGHDSVYVARVAPTGMIFVPCERGLSHNELENARPADLEAGCNVLLHAVLDQAVVA